MSRRNRAKKRIIKPDAKFGDLRIAKFINYIMVNGKKSVAEKIVYEAFELVSGKVGKTALEIFEEVIENLKPTTEVKSRRVGGATYQVPVLISKERALRLVFTWLVEMARKRSEKTMAQRLGAEIRDVLEKRGAAMKKREDTHKMAEANRAFAGYAY